MMKYFELVVAIRLNEDVPFLSSYEYISNLISRAMVDDEKLKKLHESKGFKFYTFCSFHPVESEKIYHKGRVYITNVRSLSVDFILALKKVLPHVDYPVKVISTEIHMHEYRPISELITLTPVVATVSGRCWTREDGLIMLRERCYSNAVKKYRDFFDELSESEDNFIEYIHQTNKKPLKIPYKDTSLLGNKLVIGVKSDEVSQKLAFTVLGAGALEKNSIGLGYCRAK